MAERWSHEHVDLLTQNYASKGARWVADQVGRTVNAVRFAANLRGIQGAVDRFVAKDRRYQRPPAKLAHQMLTGRTLEELARDHLAKETAVYRCNARGGADHKGRFWRIGVAIVDGAELLRRARAKGFGL